MGTVDSSLPPLGRSLSPCGLTDEPVAEIVQCGEPIFSMSYSGDSNWGPLSVPLFVPVLRKNKIRWRSGGHAARFSRYS